jgi:hypothetical protein
MRLIGSEKLPAFWIYYCLITGALMILQAGYFALRYIFPSLSSSITNHLVVTLLLACLVNSLLLFFSSIFFFIERRWLIGCFCVSAILAYGWLLSEFAHEL